MTPGNTSKIVGRITTALSLVFIASAAPQQPASPHSEWVYPDHSGKLIYKQPGQAIVEAGGVGYDVSISVPTFTALPGAAPGLVTLKLVPKKANSDYESIGIGVDPKTLQIQFLTAVDTQGGRSSFAFSNLKENRGLADKDFVFRIPRGVDVVTNGGRGQ